MDDKLKADISKIVNETVSSKLSNQQATLTFNLENIDAELSGSEANIQPIHPPVQLSAVPKVNL